MGNKNLIRRGLENVMSGILVAIEILGPGMVHAQEPVLPSNAYRIGSDYGDLYNAKSQRRLKPNSGLSIVGNIGDVVSAPADGTVDGAYWDPVLGFRLEILHGEDTDGRPIRTTYSHNNKLLVKKGDRVRRGQTIAHMGVTGTGNTSMIPMTQYTVWKKDADGDWKTQNPHLFWTGGPYKPECFDPTKSDEYTNNRFHYPACKIVKPGT